MISLDHHELSGCAPVREPAQLLHVIIVHDDLPAYGAALRLLVRSLGESVRATSVQPLPWKFSRLADRTWRERAWDDAEVRANLVAMHLWADGNGDPHALESYFLAGSVVQAQTEKTSSGWRISELVVRNTWRTGSGFASILNTARLPEPRAS